MSGRPRPLSIAAFAVLFVVAGPVMMVLHEGGHYVVGWLLGGRPTLHHASVTFDDYAVLRSYAVMRAGGPAVEYVLGTAALLWLRGRRRERREALVDGGDWLATAVALFAVRGFKAPFCEATGDERNLAAHLPAFISYAAVAAVLVVVAVGYLALIARLHPRGRRLVPLALALAIGTASNQLWKYVVGAHVLP
jgi:hypothetical protein